MGKTFRDYLSITRSKKTGEKLSSNTINSYNSNISLLSRMFEEKGLFDCTIVNMSYEELKNSIPVIEKDEDYISKNKSSDNMFSATLHHFQNYLSVLSANPTIDFSNTENVFEEGGVEIVESSLRFSLPNNSVLWNKYCSSLLAKPFVILTGNSGTGKTRIAVQFAKYLEVSNSVIKTNSNLFSAGEVINEWTVTRVTDDTYYLISQKEPKRERPIQKALLNEFIDYYLENPDSLQKSNNEVRNEINQLPTAKWDKFLYGFDATLCLMAKKVLAEGRQKQNPGKILTNSLVVPVGADWTDNTKILGYFNPLANNGTGDYVKSDVLCFIERAIDNPKIPFFLILDEMNLSHVERYFSDFLSTMESKKPILLYRRPDGCECSVKETIELPNNLFVTGTVNIDETTYMFSPKVLDRANVIEFVPEKDDVLKVFKEKFEQNDIKPAPEGMAEAFMDLTLKVRKFENGPDTDAGADLSAVFGELYDILKPAGFEFAYRTTKEITLYYCASRCLERDLSNLQIIDEQIVQKILPKIHGNKKQIGDMLNKLKDYLGNHEEFALSLAKVNSMIEKLEKNQYASFI